MADDPADATLAPEEQDMQTSIGVTPLYAGPLRSRLGLRDHPVFQALPPIAQSRAEAQGVLEPLAGGEEAAADGSLYFVLAGVLGLFPDRDRVCVSAVVSGAVHGWDQALDPQAPRPVARALIETLVCRVPAQCILETMGRDWLTRLLARQ